MWKNIGGEIKQHWVTIVVVAAVAIVLVVVVVLIAVASVFGSGRPTW